ncbi:hypothetical protein EO763_22225 [Pectobacterium odoriferum]|uniref:hypothetical protein n=1 Tax=Pectobacterium odoriferum TaxID=78398 RepID=UPI0013745452|nr:hypothetical protein [Pectobacterium odoriferum]QHP82382.1 hypothetical protein EO763_22225 [Pectobacterium odoriferum]
MADKIISINQENAVMASSITRIEVGSCDDVFVWADGEKLVLDRGYNGRPYAAKQRITDEINAALSGD